MARTQLKKLVIEKFRALNNVEVEFGDYVTVVCGKNGTSKSSILGIAAQIFSFDKDYVKDEDLSFRQIAGGAFKSQYSEHFRISDKFDVPGSMTVNIDLVDGYTEQPATARLELMSRSKSPRPVVRNNSTVTGKKDKSRNFTHPVVFLSLKRLFPIADRNYKVTDFKYLEEKNKNLSALLMSFSIAVRPWLRVRVEASVQLSHMVKTTIKSPFLPVKTMRGRSF